MKIFLAFLLFISLVNANCSISSKCFTLTLVNRTGPGTIRDLVEANATVFSTLNVPTFYDPYCNGTDCLTTFTFELTFDCFRNYYGQFYFAIFRVSKFYEEYDIVYPRDYAVWTTGIYDYKYKVGNYADDLGRKTFYYFFGEKQLLPDRGFMFTPISAGHRHRFVIQIPNYQNGSTWLIGPSYGGGDGISYWDGVLLFNDGDCNEPFTNVPVVNNSPNQIPCNINIADPNCEAGCNCFKVSVLDTKEPGSFIPESLFDPGTVKGYHDPFCGGNNCLTTIKFQFKMECPVDFDGPIEVCIRLGYILFGFNIYPVDNMIWTYPSNVHWFVTNRDYEVCFTSYGEHWNEVGDYIFVLQTDVYPFKHEWGISINIGHDFNLEYGLYNSLIKDYVNLDASACNRFINEAATVSITPTPSPSMNPTTSACNRFINEAATVSITPTPSSSMNPTTPVCEKNVSAKVSASVWLLILILCLM